MDTLRIPPTDLAAFLAERTARIERTRPDREERPPSKTKPKRRRPKPEQEFQDEIAASGSRIAIDA